MPLSVFARAKNRQAMLVAQKSSSLTETIQGMCNNFTKNWLFIRRFSNRHPGPERQQKQSESVGLVVWNKGWM